MKFLKEWINELKEIKEGTNKTFKKASLNIQKIKVEHSHPFHDCSLYSQKRNKKKG
jgi:hypothetical protein